MSKKVVYLEDIIEKFINGPSHLDKDQIIYLINRIPSFDISADEPQGEWISVNEKLPDDGKWAIWCSNNGIIGIARFKEDCYNHFYPNETSFDLEDAVVWMPLPEPYK